MICMACGDPTQSTPCACGADPRIDARFELTTAVRSDRRGVVYDGLDAGRPVRVRISLGPRDAEAERVWTHTATRWQAAPQACMAAPVAWGTLPDGRWYRVERPVQGHPLRPGGGPTSVVALLERLLTALVDLHAQAISHGGLSPETLCRRPDGALILIDFAPDARSPADDIHDAARLALALTREPFDASIRDILRRMQAPDPAERPSADAALAALAHARRWRRPTAPPTVEPPRSSAVPLFVLLLLTVGGYFWLDSRADPEFWQGEVLGRVTRATGDAPTRAGRPCEIRVAPGSHGRNNCQVQVTCDGRTIYGGEAQGFARCAGSPVHASDTQPTVHDTDPQLELVMARRRAVVSDRLQAEWSVEIGLEVE